VLRAEFPFGMPSHGLPRWGACDEGEAAVRKGGAACQRGLPWPAWHNGKTGGAYFRAITFALSQSLSTQLDQTSLPGCQVAH